LSLNAVCGVGIKLVKYLATSHHRAIRKATPISGKNILRSVPIFSPFLHHQYDAKMQFYRTENFQMKLSEWEME
jgi:hypothetical protein